MKLVENPLLPIDTQQIIAPLTDILRDHAVKINQVANGDIFGVDNAYTAAPTTKAHQQSDFVRNSVVSELGATGSKYVVFGFVCTVAGTPGTWVQLRIPTGN